ncbi:MAG: DUF1501 domain-containing protein, partial [Planctomycetes bacterium]|nr:DUF1501 domain-containing protein [Planctomycetota bacterium]
MNTVVPWSDDAYHAARPKIGIDPKEVLKIDERVGLHPSMKRLKARYDAGEVAIVQGVGYPRPNRSHFRSMAIWHSADPEEGAPKTGWLGRVADRLDASGGDPSVALSLSNPMPFALQRGSGTVMAFESEEGFALLPDKRFAQGKAAQVEEFRRLCAEGGGGERSYADRVRRTASAGVASADRLVECLHSGKASATYPRGAGGRLAQVARLIDGGYGARVYYVTAGGWDTHARQKDAHAGLLGGLSDGVVALMEDVERAGRGRDVCVLVFSEFGRRLAENGSLGTDHGTCGPVFVVGGGVKGGVVGGAPDLSKLVDGDPVATVDFRAVYRGVVEGWLGVSGVVEGGGEALA